MKVSDTSSTVRVMYSHRHARDTHGATTRRCLDDDSMKVEGAIIPQDIHPQLTLSNESKGGQDKSAWTPVDWRRLTYCSDRN